MTSLTFADLDLSPPMLSALEKIGYLTPTAVQLTAIPLISTSRDLMVQSQTGTGKTAAFGIPLIERLATRPGRGVQALIMAPTRELAKQVSDELNRLAADHPIHSVPIYGGAPMDKQIAELRFAQIVAGTPGRVLDHLRRGTLRFDGLRMVVLDEADEMLSMGFARELEQVMSYVPKERQTLLFSATIPEDIKSYAQRYMRQPEFVSLVDANVGADDVDHHYYMVSGVGRSRDLVQVIEYEEPGNSIVFCNTRADSEMVASFLQRQGYQAEFLNGDLPQREREAIMARTKDKSLRFLVATDIAARGIDISLLSHVINFQLPASPEVYIHRTGRTGRAGNKGTAISLIGPREIGVYYYLKRIYKVALQERSVPTQAEIDLRKAERRTDSLVQGIFDALKGALVTTPELRAQAVRLMERDDAVEIVEALLAQFQNGSSELSRHGKTPGPVVVPVGGVLSAVPRAAGTAPGARPLTLAGVAERVAIVQGEFRGLPEGSPVAPPVRRPPVEAPVLAAPVAPLVVEAVADAEPPSPVRTDRPRTPRPSRFDRPAETTVASDRAPREGRGSRNDRGDRSDRRDGPPPAPLRPLPPGERRLWINIGARDAGGEATLRNALADLAGLEPTDFVEVDQRLRHSYVVVSEEYAQDVVEAVDGESFQGRTIRVEFAKEEP